MKQIFLVILVVFYAKVGKAQNEEPITIGHKTTIFSKILNETRKIWVYTPGTTSQYSDANTRHPVLYLLDGDAHFFSTVGIVQQLSQANGNGVLPEMIVVAIENTDRLRDLVPYSTSAVHPNAVNPFVNFLSAELIPFIDSSYHTAPYKVLMGHSLGGLTAIDMLTNSPEIFNAYIAVDPSMWYENEKFLNHTISALPRQKLNEKRLFVGMANSMPGNMKISELKTDKNPETQHIRSMLKLDKFLKDNAIGGLEYQQKYYESEKHNTVPMLSEYDGLRFIFDYYFLNATAADFTDSTAFIALKLRKHYDNITKKMGYKVSAPEAFVNYLGYDALSKKQYKKAEALYTLNIENYPNSNKAFDSYGDFFNAVKDTANAVKAYEKSLKIKYDMVVSGKLNALLNQKKYELSVKDLERYTGVYMIEIYNIPVTLEVRNGKLWSKVPGKPDSKFVPIGKNVFTIKEEQGYTITFQMEGEKPVNFTSVQPNGTFKAIRIQ
ncbi:MAG: alpha/beta hydrolase [Saprospiraceae bacterium]|nr:alpha/beta hydrolase [Saprospiraceae bacterium]